MTTRRIDDQTGEIGRIGDPQIWENKGNATVALANSRTLEMHEAVRQLLEYPYGCIEQTTSSLLPWLTIRDLASAFPELQRSDAEIKKAVNRGFDLLLSMQTPSGGMSYWPKGTRAELWSSAYGGIGFVLARKAGFAVPDANLNRLLNYISAQLRGTAMAAEQHENLSDRCLAVYTLALAGKAEPAYHDLLFKNRERLTAEDRALLALAILESNGPAQMVDELLGPPVEEGSYLEECFGSVARE